MLWMVLTPLLMLALYTFVFGFVFGGTFGVANESRLDYALAVFVGLVAFHFLAEVLSTSSGLIVSNPNFVKKVVFPLEILPASAVLAAAGTAGVSLVLALLGVAFVGPGISLAWLQLLLILPALGLLALGCAWLLAALGVFLRDTSSVMPFFVQIVLYTSAVFYPLGTIPAWAWTYLRFNPLLHTVNLLRQTLLWQQPLEPSHLAFTWATGVAAAVVGYFVFTRAKPAFADVL